MSDIRKGRVFLSTHWDDDLQTVRVRHRRGNDREKEEHKILTNISKITKHLYVMDITYDVSLFFPDRDYWWILLVTNDWRVYTIKNNFYCNITSSDNGDVLLDVVNGLLGMKMYVSFSDSNNCRQSIYEID
ncbi:hypothetical protein PSI23_12660 [Xenorhabdus sp. XENO-10]|uniref:Uncharacterized protein n=1 Tax=Xenorhabdus yunnanensis TaxID=3025878 RepID=A0ABT5LGA3_9GAMM|nr:hypothetical protein [Xenorhabdus yunnanensis]MDC9590126.1 hypothetical protein [Xenorhabdus yunnanensis]